MSQTEEHDDDDDMVTTRKKLGGKRIIIIAGVLLLLVGGGVGAYLGGLFGGSGEPKAEEHAEAPKEEHAEAKKDEHGDKKAEKGAPDKDAVKQNVTLGPDGVVYYALPDFLVNLNNERRTSFLKMKITLELASMEDTNQVDTVQPRLIDNMNTYLRELRPADLTGSAGIHRLREELLLRANQTAHPAKINDVLFKEILVQ